MPLIVISRLIRMVLQESDASLEYLQIGKGGGQMTGEIPKSEVELQPSERWLLNVLQSLHVGVVVVDTDEVIRYANPAYTRTLGVPVGKVIGKRLVDIEPQSQILSVLRTGQSLIDQTCRIHGLGIDVLANITPVMDGGRMVGAVAVFRDISEIIALKEEASRYLSELQELRARFIEADQVVFKGHVMKKVTELALRVAQVDSTVLITGESGTGKEVLAKMIHRAGPRRDGPFVVVNCGAIPENLLESELFGYERGAFTGAARQGKPGLVEVANGGTLLLDEIGELPLSLQVKLLRIIQDNSFLRVGGVEAVSADVRFIAATNRDLKAMVREKTFREDLYYRLNVIPIHIPPLRERRADIPVLLRHFIDRYNAKYGRARRILPAALRRLEAYSWPGNVREVENLVERLVVSSEQDNIGLDNTVLLDFLAEAGQLPGPVVVGEVIALRQAQEMLERELVGMALAQTGSTRRAAKLLGVDHSTVARKAIQYGLRDGGA